MENEFGKIMSESTNEELIQIVTVQKDDYQENAINAAKNEIEIRNIKLDEINQVKDRFEKEIDSKNEIESLKVSMGNRLINFLVDSIVIFVIYLLAGIIYMLIFSNQNGPSSGLDTLIVLILFFSSFIGYYIIMENKFQKTLGKMVTKSKVVRITGEKPKLSEIINRTLSRLIPLDRISFLFRKNGIHDYLSKTIVIKDIVE